METSYGELKRKETVNVCDGKRLGKVCDVVFTYPEGKVLGIVVPGGRGFRFGKSDLFIELKRVTKVGVDVVFVELQSSHKPKKERGRWGVCEPAPPQQPPAYGARRDYGDYE